MTGAARPHYYTAVVWVRWGALEVSPMALATEYA